MKCELKTLESLYYLVFFKLILERGKNYLEVKKIVGINLMKGNYNYNNFYLINDYGFINKLNYGVIKNECLEMYLIRLDLVKENVYNYNEERFIKWLKFINAKDIVEMKEIGNGDERMEQALKFMEEFLNDEEIRNVYDKINDVERYAKRQGVKEGKAEGRRDEKFEIARNMLKINLDITSIMAVTGLTKNEIEALK